MSRDMNFLSISLPRHSTPFCGGPFGLGAGPADHIPDLLIVTLGLHPTFLFLVQTGKKQGVPENRNKGNLSTHSFTMFTCPH